MKLYTTSKCPACKVLKSWLLAAGYEFEEVNVNTEKLRKELFDLTGWRTVPVTLVKDKVIVGLDFEKIKEALEWKS